ncbi:MAG: HTH domain-containing protein [Firmicutes bacterium]|nr:HTH domain-containing protein [Bacillota bacterium]
MELTKRCRQFLAAIQEIYKKTGQPLHYEDLAQKLGVSKWTAYDMVRKLEKKGFVTINYTTNQRVQVGRSRIAIKPSTLSPAASLTKESKKILRDISQCDAAATEQCFEEFLDKAAASKSKEMYCSYLVAALMLLSSRFLCPGLIGALESLLVTTRPELGLGAAVGLLLGIIVRAGIKPEIITTIQNFIARFQQYIGEISHEERQNIQIFWQTALRLSKPGG